MRPFRLPFLYKKWEPVYVWGIPTTCMNLLCLVEKTWPQTTSELVLQTLWEACAVSSPKFPVTRLDYFRTFLFLSGIPWPPSFSKFWEKIVLGSQKTWSFSFCFIWICVCGSGKPWAWDLPASPSWVAAVAGPVISGPTFNLNSYIKVSAFSPDPRGAPFHIHWLCLLSHP